MATTKRTRTGRPVNVYLGREDLTRIRELGTWLSGKGHRVSDSQVLKAALIVTRPGKALLDAFNDVLRRDLRFRSKSTVTNVDK